MATPNCWRCLVRPSQRLLNPASISCPTVAAPFSTSTAQLAKAASKKDDGNLSRHVRTGKKLILGKKKSKPAAGKSVLPGERKAFRKRLQLSNNNALAVPGLAQMSAENLVDPAAIGQVVALPEDLIDKLRAVEAFRTTQSWPLFRSPHVLIRQETVDFLKSLTDKVKNKETVRTVITGSKESGKSILGLQAQSAAFLNDWIVINIPEGQDLTNAHLDYAPVPDSDQFCHPTYTVKLMQAIYAANKDILAKLHVVLEHIHLPITVTRNTTLAQLVNGTKEPDFAWTVFKAFWQELLLPGRPPIMFSVDGLDNMMRVSEYRSPSYELVHSFDLSLLRLFSDALGGKTQFPNGAAIIGVTTGSNARKSVSLDKALEQAEAAQAGKKIPAREPYCRDYDERIFEALKGVSIHNVKSVSKAEARSLMEYWAASGVLQMRVDERHVSERWTLAGNGILGQIERASLHATRL
ncbi:mitochondrial ribosomal death-associated protein 3-domain-containing protein [Xylariales sp. PMI_506]|nr:mitochondrial ribosomal death-associated protein 3-domain-containing protein [Xylariales sp. PMI_506]